MKAGVSYASLGCTAHASRGPAVCPNREEGIEDAFVSALRSKLDKPEFLERFVQVVGGHEMSNYLRKRPLAESLK